MDYFGEDRPTMLDESYWFVSFVEVHLKMLGIGLD